MLVPLATANRSPVTRNSDGKISTVQFSVVDAGLLLKHMSLVTFSLLGSREALNFGAHYLGEKVERPKSCCRE